MVPSGNNINPGFNLICILGPTASGKTRLSSLLASRIGGEIISADSRQVYRNMDLGTGKDYTDYRVDNRFIPVHLIDLVDAGYKYNVYEYQKDFVAVFRQVTARGSMPILCGGSGMYLEGILRAFRLINVPPDYQLRKSQEGKSMEELTSLLSSFKQLHNITDTSTRKRLIRAIEIEKYYAEHPETDHDFPYISSVVFGIALDRETRRKRISERLVRRMDAGMIGEVRNLLDAGVPSSTLIYYGLEYKFITRYLLGEYSYKEMMKKLETAIHQFAKRQMTWFRGMEKRGIPVHWLDGTLPVEENVAQIRLILDRFQPAPEE
jgi:tRNA dimethylallyltransferase